MYLISFGYAALFGVGSVGVASTYKRLPSVTVPARFDIFFDFTAQSGHVTAAV